MPTTITKTIKPAGGGDYTSLSAAEAGEQQNLVTNDRLMVFECYSGGNLGTVTIDGWTTDSTRFIRIVAATGNRHNGIYTTNKANISGGATRCLLIREAYTEVLGLALRCTTAFAVVDVATSTAAEDGVLLDGLIIRGADHGIVISTPANVGRLHVARNCVIYGNTGAANSAAFTASVGGTDKKCSVFNCTLIGGVNAIWANGNVKINSQNNYLHGGTRSYHTLSGGIINKGLNDATSNTEAITVSLRNIPHSTLTFKNVTSGSEDYHLIIGSDLIDVGEDITSSGVIKDYEEHIRPFEFITNDYDIGGDELFLVSVSGFLGGYIESFTPFPPVSGFIGGYIEGDPHPVPPAFIGGYILSKALANANRSAFLGGYIKAPGTQGPSAFAGGYISTLTFTTVPLAKFGGHVSGLFGNSAKIGGFIFGHPSYKEFVETHARVLAKANSEDVVDQPLEADAIVIFKALGQKGFNAKLLVERTYSAGFNAKLDVQKFKEPPFVEILSVNPPSGTLTPSGVRCITVIASGTLIDPSSTEWANAYIDFGEPVHPNGSATHNASISGFTTPPPWTATHCYHASGIYQIVARGQDNNGMIGSDVYRLNLASGLSEGIDYPRISISGQPRMGFVPPSLIVDLEVSTSGSLISLDTPTDNRVFWNFCNRELSKKIRPRTRYSSPGLWSPVCRFFYTNPSGTKIWVQDSLRIGFLI